MRLTLPRAKLIHSHFSTSASLHIRKMPSFKLQNNETTVDIPEHLTNDLKKDELLEFPAFKVRQISVQFQVNYVIRSITLLLSSNITQANWFGICRTGFQPSVTTSPSSRTQLTNSAKHPTSSSTLPSNPLTVSHPPKSGSSSSKRPLRIRMANPYPAVSSSAARQLG